MRTEIAVIRIYMTKFRLETEKKTSMSFLLKVILYKVKTNLSKINNGNEQWHKQIDFTFVCFHFWKAADFDIIFMYPTVYEYITVAEELLFSNENLMAKLGKEKEKKITYHAQDFLIGTLNSDINALFWFSLHIICTVVVLFLCFMNRKEQ